MESAFHMQKDKHINLNNNKERIYLYDNIKLFAILLVVVGHAIDFLSRLGGNHLEKSLFLIIYSVHMPLFIFISGLFMKPMDKSSKFPKQKVISYILIGMAIRVFSSILRLLLSMKPNFSLFDMYDTYAWFMWALAVFTIILWIFREYNVKILFAFSLVIGIMIGYDKFIGDKFAFMRIVVFLPFFITGYMIKPDMLAKILSNKWIKIASVAVILAVVVCFLFEPRFYKYLRPMFTGRNNYTSLGSFYSFGFAFRIIAYVISSAFGFSIMCIIPNKSFGQLTLLGAKTIQIYFWHKLFIIAMEQFNVYGAIASVTGNTAATFIYILIALAIAFLCSLPIFSFPTKQLLSLGKPKQ